MVTKTTITPMNYYNSLSYKNARLNWYSFVLYRLGINVTQVNGAVHESAIEKPVYDLIYCKRNSTRKKNNEIFQI